MMSGKLPAALGNLAALTDLEYNQLTRVPAALGRSAHCADGVEPPRQPAVDHAEDAHRVEEP
jgi:hypothetical protein